MTMLKNIVYHWIKKIAYIIKAQFFLEFFFRQKNRKNTQNFTKNA